VAGVGFAASRRLWASRGAGIVAHMPGVITALLLAGGALLVLGAVALFRIQGSGSNTLKIVGIEVSSTSNALFILALGVALLALAAIRGTASESALDTTTTPPSSVTTTAQASTTTTTKTPESTVTEASGTDCTVTIANQLVSLRTEPDNFAVEIRRIPPGDYLVLDTELVDFASTMQRWLRIEVETDQGWIQDSTFNVASKSDACDF